MSWLWIWLAGIPVAFLLLVVGWGVSEGKADEEDAGVLILLAFVWPGTIGLFCYWLVREGTRWLTGRVAKVKEARPPEAL